MTFGLKDFKCKIYELGTLTFTNRCTAANTNYTAVSGNVHAPRVHKKCTQGKVVKYGKMSTFFCLHTSIECVENFVLLFVCPCYLDCMCVYACMHKNYRSMQEEEWPNTFDYVCMHSNL